VTIGVRDSGSGVPLLFLHGGWGYQVYPFDRQIEGLKGFRILIPDRSGYGSSTAVGALPAQFHRRALAETLLLLDALEIERAVWWGHSDGAVIAALACIEAPRRVTAVVLEAVHLFARKPRSRAFFTQMAEAPDSFPARVTSILRDEHGEDRWRTVLRLDGAAWLQLADDAGGDHTDLYGGALTTVATPALLLHGARDPRTEPGEFEAMIQALPNAAVALLPEAGHSPHSEPAAAEASSRAVTAFLERVLRGDPPGGG
jgi:3-oxoadipate enol-lactonase